MKKVLLLSAALILGLAVVTQAQLRKYPSYKAPVQHMTAIDPVSATQVSTVVQPLPTTTKSASTVSVITIGTAANALGWGYGSGSYDHIWADNDLKAVGVIHRMGPGSAPPSFSGYLAFDHAANYGATTADWKINYQVHAATLNTGGSYYADAARYPQGAIYNPAGNTDTSNAYFCYYAPAFCNTTPSSWGGYTWGTGKWGAQADSTKHLDWYTPPPYRDIQHGFTITPLGTAFGLGNEYQYLSATDYTYYDNLYLSTGVWDNTAHKYNYTASLIPLPQNLGAWSTIEKIAADPTGNNVWIGCIGNNGGATPVFDSTYYPIFIHSSDGGQTWGTPIAVTLDGPTGIPAILNYISDAKLAEVYSPSPAPSRDQIAYTCVFDGSLTVDKWGNPHFAVGIAFPGGGFSVVSPDGANSPKFDSTLAIFDIFSTNKGTSWCARMMGIPKHFRCNVTSSGAASSIDLRTRISRNATGDKIFVSYQDTWLATATDNTAPDVFARGWDLITDKLTNNSGQDAATNVTYLSNVTQAAFCPDMAPVVFTKSNGSSLLPIAVEGIVSLTLDNPVTFKYIPDFSYAQSAFTIAAQGPVWGSDCSFPVGINEPIAASTLSAEVYPNPVKTIATLKVAVPQKGAVTIKITNLVGQTVMSVTRNVESTDTFSIDASRLTSGVYFYTVIQGSQKVTGKIVVE
ncbi:MAG: T9SS type A sorting domain-containing protein [Bacteroidetes bacterium]|nr:T9SS type A sorting domain-containing protein [Bacteroidota bacterium]